MKPQPPFGYRKTTHAERYMEKVVPCSRCRFSESPRCIGARYRCSYKMLSVVVSSIKTCPKARKRELIGGIK